MRGLLLRDLTDAARTLRRSPGFSAAVVLTLALGVGASTSIFSIVYGVLFRPLPYREAERLVLVRMERSLEGAQQPVRSFFRLADLTELARDTRSFESIGFYSTEQSALSHDGLTELVDAASVSDSFFATLDGHLEAGRGFTATDTRTSVVISDRLRRRLFGGGTAIGRALTIASRSYEVIGVAASAFQIPSAKTDVWLPARDPNDPRCCPYAAVARLKPDASASRAAEDVNALVSSLVAKSPRAYKGAHAIAVPLRDEILGDVRAPLWVLLAAVGFLLAVACANVANLLFVRNAARARETAVRMALGASRRRLIAASLAEAGLAVGIGGSLGLFMAAGVARALRSLEPAGLPRLDAVRVDLPVFLFTLAVAALVTVLVGLLPAARSENVAETIKVGGAGASAGPRTRRVHNALVVLQLAVSVMLLVGAGLLGRSLVRLLTTDLGVRPDHVATAAIHLTYGRRLTDRQQMTLVDAILDRVRSLPNVQSAGAGSSLPPHASNLQLTLKRSGDTVDYQATAVPATPGYFAALGVRLVKGRLFTDADGDAGQQVMIMTASTARRFFDVDDPIGRTMSLPIVREGAGGSIEATLVGVIDNVKYSGLQASPDDAVYRPFRQQPWPVLFVVARTAGDPRVVASMLQREIAAVDPAIVVSAPKTLDAIVSDEAAQPRVRSALLDVMAILALAIAAVGLYGVVSHSVTQRTNELGVRMALGAGRADVVALVFADGATLAGGGLVLGVAGALAATRVLTGLLYGIEATDPVSFALAAGLLSLVTVVALYVPARRASRLNPTIALRAE